MFLNGDYNTKEKPLFVNAAARTLSVLYNNKDSILSITPITRKVNASLFECEPSVIIGLLNPSVIIWFFGVFENLGFCCQ